MKTLELYINKEPGGFHNFIAVEGTRRSAPEGNFSRTSIDEMLEEAERMLKGDSEFEGRVRVFDLGHRMIARSDGIAWVTLKQLGLWTRPRVVVEPQVNEAILGHPTAALA